MSRPDLAVDTAGRAHLRAVERVSFGAALGAAFVGLVLGLLVLGWVHRSREARRIVLPRKALASATSSVPPPVPTAATAAAIVELPSSHVVLRVPTGARLFVEGRELSEPRVPRPAAGITKVLVRAEARHERWIEVTPASVDEIEVTLWPKSKPKALDVHAEPSSKVQMPPNPYE